MKFGRVRHRGKRVTAAALRTMLRESRGEKGPKVRRAKVQIAVMRSYDKAEGRGEYEAFACFLSDARPGSPGHLRISRCGGGFGRSPTAATKRALTNLAKGLK